MLPGRVIDVGIEDGVDTVKLHISEPNERNAYIALSYCWGGSQAAITTSSNLTARIESIDMKQLPKTIRDSIFVARSLGIQYVWIDSLCIVQDNSTDKAHEIAAMGQIYKKSSLTVAAGNARSVHEGFLRKTTSPAACCLPAYVSETTSGSIWLQANSKKWKRPAEALDCRAWTLQEYLLSPRILYYGTTEVAWRCKTENLDQFVRVPHRREIEYGGPSTAKIARSLFDQENVADSKLAIWQHTKWKEIVQDYSKRTITLQEDRLPALAGIARELEHIWHHTYIAGLWRRCIIMELAWVDRAHVDQETSKYNCENPEHVRRYPTWSWCTYHYPVSWFNGLVEEASLIDFELTLMLPEAPMSGITGGWISIQGKLGYGKVVKDCGFGTYLYFDNGRVIEDTDRVLLLGHDERIHHQNWGLVVRPSENGRYTRVGVICITAKETLWPGGNLRETITII